ncbi:MAG TPA: carboxypeptidase-like regulatory domain-containing protein [Nitrososphaera sp.]|nr:carboxypeptidase-like regulatory domain-containing protein [Nitrososphaera sp.]
MKRLALAVLALALTVIVPASAQSGVPVKNALVVVSEQEDLILQSMIATGGSPSNVQMALETTGLLSTSAPYISTNGSGQFELNEALQPGTYNVTVFAPGFVASSEGIAVGGSGVSRNLTIFMQPSAMVSGRVTDEQGSPIPGIVVAASSPHSANYDVTMDDGVFVLDTGLKTGQHDIYAFKPGIDIARLQYLLNNTELYPLENKIPNLFKTQAGGYLSHVSTVQLEQGKLTTLNMQLKSSHMISGRVADSAGNPVPGVAVFAFKGNGDMAETTAITDSDGKYVLDNDLAPGKYTIVIPSLFSKGYAPASSTVTVPVEEATDFVLHKSSTISGRVVEANGTPVANATIFAISKSLDVDDTQLARFLAASIATAKTDQDGKFTLDNGIADATFVVTASFGSVPVSSTLEVKSGSPANIVLNFHEIITIQGKVTDGSGKPIENASVVPSFASAISGAELFATKTGPDGAYELSIPLKDNSTRSFFDEITVSADGYKSTTAKSNVTVELEKMPAIKIAGAVIAQKPLSPSVETVLMRTGTIIFEHEDRQYDVGLQTNSRVLDGTFDPPSKSIRINLEGVQDATGKSEFSIPKEFMSGPFAISLDGRLAEGVIVTENQTYSTIAVEYDHDLKEITIQGTTAVPEFPLPAILTAAVLAATLAWNRLRH